MTEEERLRKFNAVFHKFAEPNWPGYRLFATLLSEAVDREKPWQATFVYLLLNKVAGYKVSDEMLLALNRLESGKIVTQKQTVYSAHNVEGSIIREGQRHCANDECIETFVRSNSTGKYCSDKCMREAKNRRRRERRREAKKNT